MKAWEQFERDATKYLNENFSNYAFFTHEGAADSTRSDIKVITKTGIEFYIEAKKSRIHLTEM